MTKQPKLKTPKKNGRPKGSYTRARVHELSQDELKRFKQKISTSPKHNLLFSLALIFGLRVGELARIKLNDFKHYLGEVRLSVQGLKNGRLKEYPLPSPLIKILKSWLELREKNPKHKDNPYLFPHRDKKGDHMSIIGIQYDFYSFCKKAGITGHSIHDLRHTCAMTLVRAGADAVRVRNWLRQRDIKSTQIYFEQFEDSNFEKQALKAFKDLL